MTRSITILLACTAIAAAAPAYAGGILVCNEYGCRSIVEYRPPIVALPSAIYMPPPGQEQRSRVAPQYVPPLARVRPSYPIYSLDRPPEPQRGPPVRAPVSPPQRDSASAEIEGDIMAFCDQHPDEPFCGKLGKWLRDHPRSQ